MEENVVCEETMSRTTMDKSAKTLLRLLDIAINGNVKEIDDNVDWRNVLLLAQKQGVLIVLAFLIARL